MKNVYVFWLQIKWLLRFCESALNLDGLWEVPSFLRSSIDSLKRNNADIGRQIVENEDENWLHEICLSEKHRRSISPRKKLFNGNQSCGKFNFATLIIDVDAWRTVVLPEFSLIECLCSLGNWSCCYRTNAVVDSRGDSLRVVGRQVGVSADYWFYPASALDTSGVASCGVE